MAIRPTRGSGIGQVSPFSVLDRGTDASSLLGAGVNPRRAGIRQAIDLSGQNNQILPRNFSLTDVSPVPGSVGMSTVPVTGAPDLTPSYLTAGENILGIITPRGQESFAEAVDILSGIFAPIPGNPAQVRKAKAAARAQGLDPDAGPGGLNFDMPDMPDIDAFEAFMNYDPSKDAGFAASIGDAQQDNAAASAADAEKGAAEGRGAINKQDIETDVTKQPDDLVETDPLLMTGTAEQDVGSADGDQTATQKKTNLYAGLLKQSLDSYNQMLGKAPSAAKTIEQYKQEFSDATGIDISGQPDNSAALTAFGLALMQNKAGRGFDIGELLSETGKAGEKALPLMAEARKEAKQGQIAAGQFALAQRATDSATRQKYLNEAETYIRNRRDAILGAEVARIQSIEDREDKQAAAKELERIKYGYDYNLKKIEAFNKINENEFKVTDKEDIVPLKNLPNLKITYGKSEADGRPRLLFPAQQVGQLGTALADIKEGQGSIDFMIGELELVKDQPGGINVQKAKEIAQGLAASFGYDLNEVPEFNEKGEYIGTKAADKPLTDVTAVRDRLIAQFKRFLTQETGNGISNVDVKNVEKLLGAIDFGGDPNTAIKRLREVREIFNSSEDKLKVALKDFDNRDYYLSDEEYNLTRSKISDAIVASYKLRGNAGASDPDAGNAFDFTEDADGVRTYKMF